MTFEEAKQAIDEMKAQGTSESDLLGILYYMYQKNQIELEELQVFADVLGYELTEEFTQASDEEKKKFFDFGSEGENEDETKNEGGETQPAQNQEESENDGQNQEESEGQEKTSEESEGQGKTQDDDELKQARKLYGFDK